MTTRRRTLAAALALGAAIAMPARAAKPVRIGYLSTGSVESSQTFLDALRDSLRARGWVEGRDFVLVLRFAGDNAGQFPELAATLVKERSDLIVGTCIPSTRAAKRATSTIPIVMSVDGDPVAAGLVTSLARPGANITGVSTLFEALIPKWLELLRLAVPQARRIAMVSNPDNAADAYLSARFDDAAKAVGVAPMHVETRMKSQIVTGFAEASRLHADGLVVMTEAFLAGQERIIVPLASHYRMPAIYGFREFVDAGGLMSYGISYREYFSGLAGYIDAVLRGRRPADLPVEQPTSIELTINAGTARDLGLTLAPALVARADRVVN